MWQHWVAWAALLWYNVVLLVITIGIFELYRNFSNRTPKSESSRLPPQQAPRITVIRPIVGRDPYLYECLASTLRQDYPKSRISVHFCVPSREEPAYTILEKLLKDFPEHDARIFVAAEDPALGDDHGVGKNALGPNPKIRNMSRAYREAKGEIIWIIDCNVWAAPSVAGIMVDRLCGFRQGRKSARKYKFAHQIPLAIDVSDMPVSQDSKIAYPTNLYPASKAVLPNGNRLEEMFLSSSHAKFYTAISTVAIAPCTVGKSNMFRRSHLDALTQPSGKHSQRSAGIDFFSENICEDHLISDLLWYSRVPESVCKAAAMEGRSAEQGPDESSIGRRWGNHALLLQPPCVQPVAGLSLPAYLARRSRWLRVRKFTVPAATAVEPGTESFVATAGMAYALTTLPYFAEAWGISPTWTSFWTLWFSGVTVWCVKDWLVWGMLQRWSDDGGNRYTTFVGRGYERRRQEGFLKWFKSWLGRETLAFPIWAWAILGGVTVTWRGKDFWVGLDMKVHEIKGEETRHKTK